MNMVRLYFDSSRLFMKKRLKSYICIRLKIVKKELKLQFGLLQFVSVNAFAGISDSNYRNAKYLYPLADSTGTAEMANGDARGYDGLGDVTSFDKKPPPDYKSMYFHGTDSSFVKLKVGDQTRIESDWSFAMFIYSTYPPRGTVFDYYYDSVSDSVNGRLVSRLQLILNGPRAFLNIFERERNITIEFENFFRTEEWVQLAIVHSFNSGRITILTSDDREVYTSEDNEFRVGVPMQAEIKLGGAFGTSDPFEGSIACFAIFDRELPESEFNKMKNECKDKNTQDNIIGKYDQQKNSRTLGEDRPCCTMTRIFS